MTDLRKAAEIALEAWDNWTPAEPIDLENKIETLRQALAESANSTTDFVEPKAPSQTEQEPEWIGLTEDEVVGMTCECIDDGTFNVNCAHDFSRAIEAKLKEKNT